MPKRAAKVARQVRSEKRYLEFNKVTECGNDGLSYPKTWHAFLCKTKSLSKVRLQWNEKITYDKQVNLKEAYW